MQRRVTALCRLSILCVFLGTAMAEADDGYDLWLRYGPVADSGAPVVLVDAEAGAAASTVSNAGSGSVAVLKAPTPAAPASTIS